jgi:hypothetical protein
MLTLVIAQRLGLQSDFTLGLSLLEGVCLTVVLMLLVERYLFSTQILALPNAVARQAGGVVAADAGATAEPGTQA